MSRYYAIGQAGRKTGWTRNRKCNQIKTLNQRQPMTPAERRNKIRSYGKAHAELKQALRKFPKRMWKFKPAPDRWSIHEIIVHMADSEANSYVRCRRFI